jgi:hypothetical protein
MPRKGANGEKGDGAERYEKILELLVLLKEQIAATDRKVTALEKDKERDTTRKAAALERAERAERAEKAEKADVTKSNNEGASNGRERTNNQKGPEQPSARAARAPPRGKGPGPDELAGEGWYDTLTGERGPWPRLRKTELRERALRRGGTIERECKIYEFPGGTERGQFQLWIDGNYVKNVTEKMIAAMIAAKGGLMAFDSRDLTEEFEEEEEED